MLHNCVRWQPAAIRHIRRDRLLTAVMAAFLRLSRAHRTRKIAAMAQDFDRQPREPSTERPLAARLAQYILIAAIMVLIAIALVTFR
jgi:hypothetical protein